MVSGQLGLGGVEEVVNVKLPMQGCKGLGDGGLEVRTMTLVSSSRASTSSAIKKVIAPTSALRSRPPVPMPNVIPLFS